MQTPTYNLAKFLVPILYLLTKSEYKVKDSFQFAEEICEQDPTLWMGSLDVDSLFTSIPYKETTDIWIDRLFENTDTVAGFTQKLNKIDGVAIGSPLGSDLTNVFLLYHEKKTD